MFKPSTAQCFARLKELKREGRLPLDTHALSQEFAKYGVSVKGVNGLIRVWEGHTTHLEDGTVIKTPLIRKVWSEREYKDKSKSKLTKFHEPIRLIDITDFGMDFEPEVGEVKEKLPRNLEINPEVLRW